MFLYSTQDPRIDLVTDLSTRYMYSTNNNTKRTPAKIPVPSVQADILHNPYGQMSP